jgi:8-amino-3,8-dideoxy-alpha-D-manno-octulosonate transaminase
MPGTELFGAEERKEIEDVLQTGIMFRYNHDPLRNNIWKAKDFEAEAKKITGARYALAVSNGSAAIMAALAASGIGTGDEVIRPLPMWPPLKPFSSWAPCRYLPRSMRPSA